MQILGNLWLVVPPLNEQDAIIDSLHQESSRLTGAIERIRRQCSLVADFHSRLIADVVTGKLDVREAAARLPDEAREPEQFDEVKILSKSSDMDEDNPASAELTDE